MPEPRREQSETAAEQAALYDIRVTLDADLSDFSKLVAIGVIINRLRPLTDSEVSLGQIIWEGLHNG